MHKVTKITILLVLGLTMAGCGSSTRGGLGSGGINGNWTAALTSSDGSTAYQFSATFAQSTGSYFNVTNLTFTLPGSCFASYSPGEYPPATAWFTPSDGKAAGTFGMSMASPAIIGPALGLQGVLSGSTISGTWKLSGGIAACNGNGTFTMQPSTIG
jgi:hypothetical protein